MQDERRAADAYRYDRFKLHLTALVLTACAVTKANVLYVSTELPRLDPVGKIFTSADVSEPSIIRRSAPHLASLHRSHLHQTSATTTSSTVSGNLKTMASSLANLPPGVDLNLVPMAVNPSGALPNFIDPPSLASTVAGVGVTFAILASIAVLAKTASDLKSPRGFWLDTGAIRCPELLLQKFDACV